MAQREAVVTCDGPSLPLLSLAKDNPIIAVMGRPRSIIWQLMGDDGKTMTLSPTCNWFQ